MAVTSCGVCVIWIMTAQDGRNRVGIEPKATHRGIETVRCVISRNAVDDGKQTIDLANGRGNPSGVRTAAVLLQCGRGRFSSVMCFLSIEM
jgi:hypothetical protein